MHGCQIAKRVCFLGFALTGSILMVGCQEPTGGKGAGAQKPESSASTGSTSKAEASEPRLSAYSPGATAAPLQHCNLEAAAGTKFAGQPVAVKGGQSNEFRGWVDDGGLANPAVWLRFDEVQGNSHLHIPVRLTVERQDVSAAYPDASRTPGFTLDLSANALPHGQYHVYIAAVSSGVAHVCDNGRQIDVGP